MIKVFKYIASISLVAIIIYGCEKNLIDQNQQWQYLDENAANVKVVNVTSFNISGVTTTRYLGFQDNNRFMGNGLGAPGSWPSTTYAQLKPGNSNILLLQDRKVAATATVPASIGAPLRGDTAAFRQVTLEAKKFYSMFALGDSATRELIVVEDVLEIDTSSFAIRFANMVTSPQQSVRLFSRAEKKDLFTNVAYKQVTPFVKIPFTPAFDTLDVFAGTTRLYSLNNISKSRGRMYTVYTQGRAPFRTPAINSYTNR